MPNDDFEQIIPTLERTFDYIRDQDQVHEAALEAAVQPGTLDTMGMEQRRVGITNMEQTLIATLRILADEIKRVREGQP